MARTSLISSGVVVDVIFDAWNAEDRISAQVNQRNGRRTEWDWTVGIIYEMKADAMAVGLRLAIREVRMRRCVAGF